MKYLCNVSDIKINLRNLKSVLTGISVPMIVVHSFRNKDKVLGAIVVNIDGDCNKLTIWCVAGTKFSVATNSQKAAWAKQNGCKEIYISGKDGYVYEHTKSIKIGEYIIGQKSKPKICRETSLNIQKAFGYAGNVLSKNIRFYILTDIDEQKQEFKVIDNDYLPYEIYEMVSPVGIKNNLGDDLSIDEIMKNPQSFIENDINKISENGPGSKSVKDFISLLDKVKENISMTKVDNIEKTVDETVEQVKEAGEAEKSTASEVVKTRKPRRKNRSKEEIAAEKKAKADRARARAEAKAKRESEKKKVDIQEEKQEVKSSRETHPELYIEQAEVSVDEVENIQSIDKPVVNPITMDDDQNDIDAQQERVNNVLNTAKVLTSYDAAKTLDDIEFNSEAEVSYKIERGIPVVSINNYTGQAIDIQESSGLDNNMIAFNVSGGVINIRVPSTSSNIEIRFKRHIKGLED